MELIGEIPPAHAWEGLGFPGELGGYLDWLEKNGAGELLWTPEPASLPAVAAALRGRRAPLSVVLPNMSLYARDAMDAGPTGAVLKRFRALPLPALARLGLRLLPRAPALLQKRFSAGALLLAEAELARLTALPVGRVVLHSSVVDMALAFGCREMFDLFLEWSRARGVDGAFMTHNLGLWEGRTDAWGLRGLSVFTPVNRTGYLALPDRETVLAYCRAHPESVWATETGEEDDLEELGVTRAVIPWAAYRPRTLESRLKQWRARADAAALSRPA